MIPAILALPDQPCQILLLIKDRLDAQRPRHLARHARHHRPREIERPEPRIEPFQPGFPVMWLGCGNQSRSEENTSELQSIMCAQYAVLCLKQNRKYNTHKYQLNTKSTLL